MAMTTRLRTKKREEVRKAMKIFDEANSSQEVLLTVFKEFSKQVFSMKIELNQLKTV